MQETTTVIPFARIKVFGPARNNYRYSICQDKLYIFCNGYFSM